VQGGSSSSTDKSAGSKQALGRPHTRRRRACLLPRAQATACGHSPACCTSGTDEAASRQGKASYLAAARAQAGPCASLAPAQVTLLTQQASCSRAPAPAVT
jgi:hypothetical protein